MLIYWLVPLVLFGLGAMVGSFINVVVYRTWRGEDWVRGRSRCDWCKKFINWYDNVPLLSYVLLGGKCRACKKKISMQHVVVEVMTGLLFVWWYIMGQAFFQLTQSPLSVIQPVFWLVVGILLLIIVVADWLYMIIPDYAVIALGGLALVYRLVLGFSGAMRWEDVGASILVGLGLGCMFFGLWYFTKGKGLGFGDVKYVVVMGWLLGWPRAVVGVMLAFVIGAIVGLGLIGFGKKGMRSAVAFGPFLVLGTVLGLVYGMGVWEWYWGMLL